LELHDAFAFCYPQCVIARSDGIHCLRALFTLRGEQACWGDTLFYWTISPLSLPKSPVGSWMVTYPTHFSFKNT